MHSVPARLACCRADNGARCAAPSTIPCASTNRRSEKFRSAVNAVVSVPAGARQCSLTTPRSLANASQKPGVSVSPDTGSSRSVEHELAWSAGFAHRDFAGTIRRPASLSARRTASSRSVPASNRYSGSRAAPCRMLALPISAPQGTQSNCGRGQSPLDLTSAEA